MQNEPDILARTFEFGVRATRLGVYLIGQRESYRLVDQFVAAAVSIGANVEEAQGAQSKADFVSKMSIALKEAREAVFRLRVFISADIISPARGNALLNEGEEIKRILGKITANADRNR